MMANGTGSSGSDCVLVVISAQRLQSLFHIHRSHQPQPDTVVARLMKEIQIRRGRYQGVQCDQYSSTTLWLIVVRIEHVAQSAKDVVW
jgi:hypothetical protein